MKIATDKQYFPNLCDGEWRTAMTNLDEHETGNGGYSQKNTYGNSPFLDLTIKTNFVE
jgi:hypothetical protein